MHDHGCGHYFNSVGIENIEVTMIVLKDSWLLLEKTFNENVVQQDSLA